MWRRTHSLTHTHGSSPHVSLIRINPLAWVSKPITSIYIARERERDIYWKRPCSLCLRFPFTPHQQPDSLGVGAIYLFVCESGWWCVCVQKFALWDRRWFSRRPDERSVLECGVKLQKCASFECTWRRELGAEWERASNFDGPQWPGGGCKSGPFALLVANFALGNGLTRMSAWIAWQVWWSMKMHWNASLDWGFETQTSNSGPFLPAPLSIKSALTCVSFFNLMIKNSLW